MQLKFLGTGDAAGVPAYGCRCSACQRAIKDILFSRRPCSAVLEADGERILIDAGVTDLASRFPPGSLSRILLTHYHVDHVQGLFHLRWGCNTRLPVHGPDDHEGCADLFKHPGILDFSETMKPFQKKSFGNVHVTPVPLKHSKMALGYCFVHKDKRLAYLCDTVGLPNETYRFLQHWQPNHIILDCTHPPHEGVPRNHNDFNMALEIADQFNYAKLGLTHISHTFDLWLDQNKKLLPENVYIAKDEIWKVTNI